MATQAQVQTQSSVQSTGGSLLKTVLYENSVFSLVSGLLMLALPGTVAEFMGVESTTAFSILGVLLLVWSADVFWTARQNPINLTYARMIIGGDLLWVVGSAAVLLFNPFDFSTAGNWATLIVADIVMIFAIAQYIGVRRLNR